MKVWSDFSFSWPGGESSHAARQRGVGALRKVVHEHRGKNVVVGNHGNIMALMMNHFDSAFDFEFWRQLQMPDIYHLSFDGDWLKEVQRVWKP